MTFQEILEGIARHRADPINFNIPSQTVITGDLQRKIDEIEWALQAITEKLRDQETHNG